MVIEAIRRFLERHQIAPCGIVSACSGGSDSTALLVGLAELRADGFRIICGHVNHHLRGQESDLDEAFVREICSTLDVPFMTADGTLGPAEIRDSGIEGAARRIRFERLQSMRGSTGATLIATAHQKNDQAETVVMRMLTGTGLSGLRGIHPVRDDGVIRPLLDVTRAEIEHFLADREITPRFDRSNDDPRFLRNRVRAALREYDADAVADLAGLASHAQSVWPALETMLDDIERSSVTIDVSQTMFRSWPPDPWIRQALLHRHIRRLDPQSRDVSAEDLRRLTSDPESITRVTVTRSLELVRESSELILRRRSEARDQEPFEVAIEPDSSVFIPEIDQTISLKRARVGTPALQRNGTQLFALPSEEGCFVIRNRRAGDRFQPLGMTQDKKLKDFLIDRKIGAALRDRIPLLIWNGEIVWVAGVEVSERFKVTGPEGALYEVMVEHGPQISETDLQP